MLLKKSRQSFIYFRDKAKLFDLSAAFAGSIFGYNLPYFNHRIKNYLGRYPYSQVTEGTPKERHPIHTFLSAAFEKSHPFVYFLERSQLPLVLFPKSDPIAIKDLKSLNPFGEVAKKKTNLLRNGVLCDTHYFIEKAANPKERSDGSEPLKKEICFLNHGPLQLKPREELIKMPYLLFDLSQLVSYPLKDVLLSQKKLDVVSSPCPITEALIKDIGRYFNSQPVQTQAAKLKALLEQEVSSLSKKHGLEVLHQEGLFVLLKMNRAKAPLKNHRVCYKNTTFLVYNNFLDSPPLALIGIPLTEPLHHLPAKLKEMFEYLGE